MLKNRLRELRAKNGFTQEELAKKVGVSRQMIGLIERGESDPSITVALKVSMILNKRIEEIFYIH